MTITISLLLPPKSVIGNPYSVPAPAQAITFSELGAITLGSNLLINQSLPTTVDFDNLPPQTVVGNATALSSQKLACITFNTLSGVLVQSGLPLTVYKSFDPDSVPPYTLIGNLSTGGALAVPVAIGSIAPGLFRQVPPASLIYFQNTFAVYASPGVA